MYRPQWCQQQSPHLRKLLIDRWHQGIDVEIVDPRQHFLTTSIPSKTRRFKLCIIIKPGGRILFITADCREIGDRIFCNFLVCMYKIGRDYTETAPSIVFMEKPRAHVHWWAIKRELRRIMNLQVAFVVGSCKTMMVQFHRLAQAQDRLQHRNPRGEVGSWPFTIKEKSTKPPHQ